MRGFLLQLHNGTSIHKIAPGMMPLLRSLIEEGYIKHEEDHLLLDRRYRIATIQRITDDRAWAKPIGTPAKDLLIHPNNLHGAEIGDIVLLRRLFAQRGGALAKVVRILRPAHRYSLGYVKQTPSGPMPVAMTNDRPLTLRNPPPLTPNQLFVVDNRTQTVIEVLGDLYDATLDEAISLALFQKRESFLPDVTQEADRITPPAHHPPRVDLRDLPFCTIDPTDAKDFDDAIYYDAPNHTLYVAIADVSHYVPTNSAIDQEAKARGFTLYFPTRSIPMLPKVLSEEICSLNPGCDRFAYVCEIKLDPSTLQPTSHRFYEATIRSHHRFDYDTIDRYFQTPDTIPSKERSLLTMLMALKQITDHLRHQRLQRGYDFSETQVRLRIDTSGQIIQTIPEQSTPAHALIEECMLLANKAAASHFERGIFRVHEPPSIERINTLLETLSTVGIEPDLSQRPSLHALLTQIQHIADTKGVRSYVDRLIIQTLKQAHYHHENMGHFGLGFEHYTHFTSPIRRYADLVVHRLLKAIFAQEEHTIEAITYDAEALAMDLSEKEQEITRIEWDYKARKYARWAHAHPEASIQAIVFDTQAMPHALSQSFPIGMAMRCDDASLSLFDRITTHSLTSHIPQATIIAHIQEKHPLFAPKPTDT